MQNKALLSGILFFIFLNSFAQTQAETQEWLRNKLEFWSLSPKCGGTDIAISFSECEMIIKGVNAIGDKSTTIIPIADLGEINFEKKVSANIAYTDMIIQTKDFAQTILHKGIDGLTYEFVTINLQVSQGLDNVNKRKIKLAFAHLGKMCSESNKVF